MAKAAPSAAAAHTIHRAQTASGFSMRLKPGGITTICKAAPTGTVSLAMRPTSPGRHDSRRGTVIERADFRAAWTVTDIAGGKAQVTRVVSAGFHSRRSIA
jgi:hypothetical protein